MADKKKQQLPGPGGEENDNANGRFSGAEHDRIIERIRKEREAEKMRAPANDNAGSRWTEADSEAEAWRTVEAMKNERGKYKLRDKVNQDKLDREERLRKWGEGYEKRDAEREGTHVGKAFKKAQDLDDSATEWKRGLPEYIAPNLPWDESPVLRPLVAGLTPSVGEMAALAGLGLGVVGAAHKLNPVGRVGDYLVDKVKEKVRPERKPVGDAPALDPFTFARDEYIPLPGGGSTGAADRQAHAIDATELGGRERYRKSPMELAEAATMRGAEHEGYGTRVKETAPKEKWIERWMREEAPKQWLQDEVRRRKANDEEY